MLISVLDDSGTHADAKYSSCIGVVADIEQWVFFDAEWRRQLQLFGVDDFHAERFYARDRDTGERVDCFKAWDDDKAHAFIGALMAISSSMEARIVGATIDTSAFNDFTEKERAFLTGQLIDVETGKRVGSGAPRTPFQLAFGVALHRSLACGRNQVPLYVVLDHNDKLKRQAAITCRQFGKILKYRGLVRPLQTQSRREYSPLHLADLAAYLWNRFLTTGKLTDEQSFAMDSISSKGNKIMRFDRNVLSKLKDLSSSLLSVANERDAARDKDRERNVE